MKARPILGKLLRLTVARREVAAPQKKTAPGWRSWGRFSCEGRPPGRLTWASPKSIAERL